MDKATPYESCLRLDTVARSLTSGRIRAQIARVCIYRKCFGNIHINYIYMNRPPAFEVVLGNGLIFNYMLSYDLSIAPSEDPETLKA